MENQQLVYAKQETNTSPNSGTPAAYFVILKQAPGSGGTERSMLVAKQELGGVGCILEKRNKLGPGRVRHPFECHSGNVCVTLENQEMWSQFYKRGTEMILTKHGRRMFPNCRFCISGLDSSRKYILVMDIAPVDNHRYKWNGRWWEVNGKAEPHVLGRVYIHPNSPSSGSYWMRQPISFYKLKLTNNTLDQEGHIILHSMHRYLPRLHVIPADKLTDVIPLNGPNVLTFTFPQTEFVAVTAYQNIKITQLKIDFNPFAKGFRDDGLNSRPMRELRHRSNESTDGGCSDDSASSRSVITEPSGHFKIKSEEQSETQSEHRKMQGDIHASPGASFDGELYNTDEEEGSLEAEIPKTSEFVAGMGMRQKRTTESILKHLPNLYSTHPFSTASSEDQEESFNIIVKEEPPDDDEYDRAANPEDLDGAGLKCKKEEEENYLDSSSSHSTSSRGQLDGTSCELASKTIDKNGASEVDATAAGVTKRPLSSPEGAAKAKMLRIESNKMPVVYLEPCTVTKGTIKISELPQNLLSPCRRNWSPLIPLALRSPNSAAKPTCSPSSAEKTKLGSVDSSPECTKFKENDSDSVSGRTKKKRSTSAVAHNSIASHSTPSQKASGEDFGFCKIKHTEKATSSRIWRPAGKAGNCPGDSPVCSKSTRLSTKAFSSGIWRPPDGTTDSIEETPIPRTSSRSPRVSKQQFTARAYRRGRSKKLRQSTKPSHSVSETAVSLATSEHLLEQEEMFCDVSPDLDDVEGVTFVSYASQDALQSHLVEQAPEDPSDPIQQTVPQESDEEKIGRLEEQLIEDLTHLDPRVILHPSLKIAGVKPSSLMSTVSLNLKPLGVVILPTSAGVIKPDWRDTFESSPSKQTDQGPLEEEIPFVSRTGKTNDFTKLKGWKQKLVQQSGTSVSKETEASTSLESTMKNRSAFLSDKLDEYLENEEKIIKQRADLCVSKISKVVYQMPTKSSSYVRTLDSVLKHRAPEATLGQPHSSSRAMVSSQPISVGSVSKATKQSGKVVGSDLTRKERKPTCSAKPTSKTASPPIKTSNFPLCSARMRPPALSQKQIKLMDLENGALWDGKSRTYITEERAEASLITLLTAEGTLQSRKHRMIPKRAPVCKNEFCRLGCICSSLSQMKQPPTHCRKPECMFNCKCPKREVLVLKTFGRRRRQLNKALREDLIFYDALADDDEWKPRTRKRKKKKVVEYAIPEPEQPVRSYPLWVRQEGEVDPEPVYTAPHLESCHTSKCPSLSQPQSPLSPKELDPIEAHTVLSTPASSPKPSEADEKGPVYWYFESMMTCARVCVFERKDVERPIICTCSSEHGCGQENSPYSKVNNKETVEPCKLKECSDSSSREVLDCEKLEDYESISMSPNPAEMCISKKTQEMGLAIQCDSPQKEIAELPSTEPQTSAESKNTPKLIEIISNCNWEAERANILKVIACHTANKGTSEKIYAGNFLVEIMSNYGKCQDLSPGGVPIYSSLVKITQPGNGEKDGKMSVHTASIQKISQSSGRKVTETRLIAPKATPINQTKGKNELTTFPSALQVASKGKPVSNATVSTSHKSGMIQVSGNETGETKLTLGQVGALHAVNSMIANLTRKVKSFSSTSVSSTSAQFASKDPESCTTPIDGKVSQNTIATSVNKATGIHAIPDSYTHLVINKDGALQKSTPCFSSLQPVLSGQQSGTPLSTLPPVSITAPVGTSLMSTVMVITAAPSSIPVIAGQSQSNGLIVSVTTGTSPPSNSLKTTDALGAQSSAVLTGKRLSEESAESANAVETPAKCTATTVVAVISASVSGVRTMLTPVLSPSSSTMTAAALTNTVNTRTTIMSVAATPNNTAGIPRQPEATNSAPPDSSKAMKANGPRLLLIPTQSGVPSVRPVQNLQLAPGQKMILQPLRCPGGNLFRHPNGQIIQLVPLPNSGPGNRPNLHQMVTVTVRNPGSTGGIRFPTPTKASFATPILGNNAPRHIVPHGIMPQRGRPRITSATKANSFALNGSSVIVPVNPMGLAVPITTTPRTKFITVNAANNPVCAGNLVPLQPAGFALLQLPPGQKLLPNTIITTGGPLRFVSPPPGVPLAENAGSEKNSVGEKTEKIANLDISSTSEEQLIEPGLEDIHFADSELVETTVSENTLGEDHVSADPLPEVKPGDKGDAAPSSPSLSEVDDELEDDSLGQKAVIEKSTPAELADHSYTSEMHAVEESENRSSFWEDAAETEKDTSNETAEKESLDIRPSTEDKKWVPDEIMEVKTEVKENSGATDTSDTSFNGKADTQKDSGNEELEFDKDLLYANYLESDKDTDFQSDLEDGEIPSDIDEIDVEKMFDSTSSEEAVDIETVDELSEKINIARLIASASRHRTKAKCHFHNPYLIKKAPEEEPKPKEKRSPYLSKEAKAQLDALVVYRTAHTVNERRRRSEMRDLFEKLKRTLGLRREQKASKHYILKQAFAEIQNLQDHSDRLAAERSIQARKRDLLIRKVSLLTGKTEEVILKKLEYICAKQRALDIQKKNNLQQEADTGKQNYSSWRKACNSSETMDSLQKVAMNLQTQKPPNITMLTNGQDLLPDAGKPLILSRKRSSAPDSPASSVPLTPGSLLMTPQGQVLTLKGPLVSGETPVFTTEGLLHGNQLIPKGDDTIGTGIAGIALVTIQLQGLPVPLQVNNVTVEGSRNSTGTVSTQSSTRPPGTETEGTGSADLAQGEEPKSEALTGSVDNKTSSFLMPRIVNVTSLATGEAPSLNLEGMSDSFIEVDPQALDFSMKGRKQRTTQGQQSSIDSKRTSDLKNSSQVTGEFTVLGESEVMPFLIVSSEASKAERHQQQTQQVPTPRVMCSDKVSRSPKALDLSGLPVGAAVSCTEKAWTQEETSTRSVPTTQVILGDKLELQVMSSQVQTCSTGKTIGLSDGDAELSSSQLLEPLLKANGTATGEMDTEGYEPFTSLLNEFAFLNHQFSDSEENPDASSMSDHQALSFIDSGNQGDDMDELSLIHGPIRLVDIDGADEATELKQVSERESGGSTSPLVLQLEGEDLNVEQLLSGGMPVDSQNELDDGTLDFEGNSTCGADSSVNVSPPPLVHMKASSPSGNTEVPSSLDMLWRPMPKLAPLGLIRVSGKGESVALTEHSSENNKPMPALARISSPQQTSTESPSSVSGEHYNNSSVKE
ncbi:MAX dimerization protein MGA a isoform X1 [Carcharodon carcharias]|uniref:MAX dimerization protein MGA a isoform X1 n=1 Tax=Carcharodon carcharias TaxID=13397 RepID=UPI001B7F2A02|nr:MAX dimerization protein MGA a isoform X1 [Carcharodon carcharias]XP_041070270.1 MAX dimerization protein MGA a isoform X1 [Carcharodon carcharias]